MYMNTEQVWCTFTVSTTAARSRQDSWASSAQKIWPLEKQLGRKPATPQIIWKSAGKNFCNKFLVQFLQIIVNIRPQFWSLELGRFLGRKKFYWAIFGSSGPEFGHLAPVVSTPAYGASNTHVHACTITYTGTSGFPGLPLWTAASGGANPLAMGQRVLTD